MSDPPEVNWGDDDWGDDPRTKRLLAENQHLREELIALYRILGLERVSDE